MAPVTSVTQIMLQMKSFEVSKLPSKKYPNYKWAKTKTVSFAYTNILLFFSFLRNFLAKVQ